jgi:hypothetical protein
LTYGIKTDAVLESITVSNGDFSTMYQGIVLDENVTGFRAVSNRFDGIYAEGIVYDDVELNATAYNVFYDVGNAFGSGPVSPVITFGNDNNVSINDFFTRTDLENNIEPRVRVEGGVTTTGSQLQVGRYSRETGRTFSLLASQASPQTIFVLSNNTVRAFTMDYTIVVASEVRHGRMTVSAKPGDDSSISLSYTDDFTETGATGVTLLATQDGELISMQYTSTFSGPAAQFTYSISHLA